MVSSPDRLPAVFPESWLLDLEALEQHVDEIIMVVSVGGDAANCPVCGTPSPRVHSRYTRTLRDLPWHRTKVQLRLRSRRFFCIREDCCRKIFAERLPQVAQRYSRQTERLAESVRLIGYALGGEAGCRLAQHLGFECSADMLLRAVKAAGAGATGGDKVRVVGIDDWAWRKRQRYGTIVVDLEKRCPIDILPDRSTETVEAWLRQHPEIEVVSRDRAGAYAEAAAKGAPQAIQVADRWHLLCNLTQTIQRILERLGSALRQVRPVDTIAEEPVAENPEQQVRPDRHQEISDARREKRKERYEAVMAAHQRGSTQRAIARELKLSRKTVSRFLRSADFPERASRRGCSHILQFQAHLEQRWAEGCNNAAQLCREIQKLGYRGKISAVRDFLRVWRNGKGPQSRKRPPSPRALAFWLAKPAPERTPEQETWAQAVTHACPEAATAENLAQNSANNSSSPEARLDSAIGYAVPSRPISLSFADSHRALNVTTRLS